MLVRVPAVLRGARGTAVSGAAGEGGRDLGWEGGKAPKSFKVAGSRSRL